MFRLSVVFGKQDTNWAFLYKTKEAAQAVVDAHVASPHTRWIIKDDFGQTASVPDANMASYMLEELDVSRMAAVEMALHQARIQAKAQEMAKTDPVLKTAMNSRGPSVLTPQYGFPQ